MAPPPAFTAPAPCGVRYRARPAAAALRRLLAARAPRRRPVMSVANGELESDTMSDGVDIVVSPGRDLSNSSIQTLNDVEEIVALVEEFDLRDFRIADGGVAVEISRPGGFGFEDGKLARPTQVAAEGAGVYQMSEPDVVYKEAPSDVQGEEPAVDVPAVEEKPDIVRDPDTVDESDFVVKSDRVGFFFSGAKNKLPLVNVGDHVDFNQPVCIIEQLGQQYVYLSETTGTVSKIFVEDGDAVEYNQQVMVIRPD